MRTDYCHTNLSHGRAGGRALVRMLAAGLVLLLSSPVQATLYEVSWESIGGPEWTGIVDSTTDALTITSWSEDPAVLPYQYFELTDFATTWNAISATGAVYDVPDDWDMTIGTNWGFVRPVSNAIGWSGGGPNPHFAGWGAACLIAICTIPFNFVDNENVLLGIPIDGQSSPAAYARAGGVVITEVPEPGTLVIAVLGLAGLMQARQRRRSPPLPVSRISAAG